MATNKHKQQKYQRLQKLIKIIDYGNRNESYALRMSMPTEYKTVDKNSKSKENETKSINSRGKMRHK